VDKYYELLERTHNNKRSKEDYILSSLKPDFTFRDRLTNKFFYVEAKIRASYYKCKIEWCNNSQLKRYLEYNNVLPVLLIS
jgi:hypothetical protein